MKRLYKNKDNINPVEIIYASRGIILKDKQILLTYSNHFQDYTTPGGRMEKDESLEETLIRELKEEVGIEKITFKPIGYIDEYCLKNENYILKKNYYYLIKTYENGQSNRRKDELNYGMESKWVSIDEAISQNSKQIKERLEKGLHKDNPFITTMIRENHILTYIKEHYL